MMGGYKPDGQGRGEARRRTDKGRDRIMEEKDAQFPETPDIHDIDALPDEFLEAVAGGQLDVTQTWWLDTVMSMYKKQGKTLEDMIAYNHDYDIAAEVIEEMDEYVKQHW